MHLFLKSVKKYTGISDIKDYHSHIYLQDNIKNAIH